jgi:ribosomal-protein-alanine N-acetyltransferase
MMKIERMTADHVPQIAELEKICFNDPWSEKSIASELDNRLSLWLVAMDGDRVAGYVGSQSVLGETDMMNIAVHPDFRRRGIAEELVMKLVEELKVRGNHSLMLEVRVSNDPARNLYEKLGFLQVGLRKNYYRNPKEDACILRKEFEYEQDQTLQN